MSSLRLPLRVSCGERDQTGKTWQLAADMFITNDEFKNIPFL